MLPNPEQPGPANPELTKKQGLVESGIFEYNKQYLSQLVDSQEVGKKFLISFDGENGKFLGMYHESPFLTRADNGCLKLVKDERGIVSCPNNEPMFDDIGPIISEDAKAAIDGTIKNYNKSVIAGNESTENA